MTINKQSFLIWLDNRKYSIERGNIEFNKMLFDYIFEQSQYEIYRMEEIKKFIKEVYSEHSIKKNNSFKINYSFGEILSQLKKRVNIAKIQKAVTYFKLWIEWGHPLVKKEKFIDASCRYSLRKALIFFLEERVNIEFIQGYAGFCVFVQLLEQQKNDIPYSKREKFHLYFEEFKFSFEKAKMCRLNRIHQSQRCLYIFCIIIILSQLYRLIYHRGSGALNHFSQKELINNGSLNIICAIDSLPERIKNLEVREKLSNSRLFSKKLGDFSSSSKSNQERRRECQFQKKSAASLAGTFNGEWDAFFDSPKLYDGNASELPKYITWPSKENRLRIENNEIYQRP